MEYISRLFVEAFSLYLRFKVALSPDGGSGGAGGDGPAPALQGLQGRPQGGRQDVRGCRGRRHSPGLSQVTLQPYKLYS